MNRRRVKARIFVAGLASFGAREAFAGACIDDTCTCDDDCYKPFFVHPAGTTPLIGQLQFEQLDLVIDASASSP